ncbi:MAG: ABC transporter ATP-binding protein/permease [Campylobacterales bacterium]|nr:ABC transporter ATP-binding protein/permease [Campylobacterales bacterium]
MKKQKRPLIIGQFVTLLAILVSIPIPLMLPVLVDEVLLNKPDIFVGTIDTLFGKGSPFYYVAVVTLAVIILRFFYFMMTVVIAKIFTAISKNIIYEIRVKVIEYLKTVSMNEYESLGSGKIGANLITDVNTLDLFIITGSGKLVASALTLLAIGIIMIAIHPVLGLLIITIQPIIMMISKKISKSVTHLKKEENQSIEEFQEDVGEVLELYGQIKASNKEEEFFNRTIKLAKDVKDTSNNYGYKSVAAEKFSFTLFLSVFEILRASGLILVAYSDLSIGMMFAMFGYIWFIMTPIQDLLSMQYSYASAKGAMERLNKIFELGQEPNGEKTLDSKNGININIKDLIFSYNKDKTILSKISMIIPFKEKVALIGASGSGKTTLAQIIAGFYTKDNGDLLFNQIPIENLEKRSIRESIFLVLQMPILFNNTLRFNITMGDESITDEEIYKALEIAQLKDVIEKMSEGLDTVVGRHGIRLSGGQRQRISIARMIIADPKVVIFDESTSALDVHVEAMIFESLKPILKDKTVITIAHRLSTVKNADRVFVLDEGKLVQEGSHKELEDEQGHYLEFVKKQLV